MLAGELKVISDIYRVPILVGSFWLSLSSEGGWRKTLKHSSRHQELWVQLQFMVSGIVTELLCLSSPGHICSME